MTKLTDGLLENNNNLFSYKFSLILNKNEIKLDFNILILLQKKLKNVCFVFFIEKKKKNKGLVFFYLFSRIL